MRGAVLPIAAAALLSACTTTDTQRTAASPPRTDYSHLSCREIAAQLALAIFFSLCIYKGLNGPFRNNLAPNFDFDWVNF